MTDSIAKSFINFEFCIMCTAQCSGACINLLSNKNYNTLPCIKANIKIDQLEIEYKKWETLLSSLKNENGTLILKLSHVVDGNENKAFILKAEHFHNEFITRDEYIADLKKDIKLQRQLIKNKETYAKTPVSLFDKHQKLKNEISSFEKNFLKLKHEFNQTISSAS